MLYRIHCLCTWGGVGKLLLVVHCSLLGWKVTPSMHFYTVHICIYNYIAMFWTRILLYLLVSVSYKSWSITGDFFFFFSRKNMLVIFVSLSSWSSPLVAHTGIRNGFLEELREARLFLHESCPTADCTGGWGERGKLTQVLLLKHALSHGKTHTRTIILFVFYLIVPEYFFLMSSWRNYS